MKQPETIFDKSLWVLILSNLISIVMAFTQGWDINQILWVYWAQSVIIGIINVFRIRGLKEFSTKNLLMNNRPVPETQEARNQVANFFTLHYGMFHFGYALFLWQRTALTSLENFDLIAVMLLAFGFMGAHGFSYRHNIIRDFKHQKPDIGTLMFYPYLRIIPMHLVIIFGATVGSSSTLVIFMVLKTFADAGMHMIEHHLFRRKLP